MGHGQTGDGQTRDGKSEHGHLKNQWKKLMGMEMRLQQVEVMKECM